METLECLHIESAKEPWRASNKVKPMPQMVMYLQRQEAIGIHQAYMDLYLGLDSDEDDDVDDCVFDGGDVDEGEETVEVPGLHDNETHDEGLTTAKGDEGELGEVPEAIAYPNPRQQMAKHPTKQNVPLLDVIAKYSASDIIPAITAFLGHRLGVPLHDVLLSPHNYVNVWHKLYLHHQPPTFAPFDPRQQDVVRASPPILDARNQLRIEPFWDVALYLEKPNRLHKFPWDPGFFLRPSCSPRVRCLGSSEDVYEKHGLQRYRAGRIRVFFTLPGHLKYLFSGPLAYVEAFEAFDASASPFSGMHSTRPEYDSRNRRRTLVIPVSDIVLACHLAPKFHLLDQGLKLTAHTDLFAISQHFWLNHYYNHNFYRFIQHW